MTPTRFFSVSLACALSIGCGGGALHTAAFSDDWQSDGGKSIEALEARIGSTHAPESKGLAVGVTATGLVAVGLDGSNKWTHAALLDSRPAIAGNVVVYTAGGNLVALDGSTGSQLWSTKVGDKRLRGAGDDGSITVASLGGSNGGGTLLVAVNRSGAVVRSWSPQPDVGVPAILSGVVFAPWGSQYVSALDVAGGGEVARLLARTVVSRAIPVSGSLDFGENALVRFDSAIGKSAQNAAHVVKLPERELPGKPSWYPDGATINRPFAGAPDSIRFYARPAETGGKLGLDSERFAGTYFRIVVGFNAQDGALRWVRTLPAEVIGGDAANAGFAFCDEAGNIFFAGGRAGGDAGHVSLGQPVKGCVVSAGSFHVPDGQDQGSLANQITVAINLPETQMATIQRFLLRELGTNQDPAITKTLLDLASDARTQPEVLAEARNLLASRRNGAEFMTEALGRHYDFLSDVLRPPPVGPLADALAAMGDKSAAPLLAAHLNDPSDGANDVRRAAHALVTLATPSEVDAVKTFFSLYRATADDDDLVNAVIDAAKILVNLGGAEGAAVVKSAAIDPLTNSAVKDAIANLVPPAETPSASAK